MPYAQPSSPRIAPPRRDPTFRQLQVFVAVVQEGGFGAAARALGISQHAVSKHIAALERVIDAALFVRSPGQAIKLTPRGIVLVDVAATLLHDRRNIDGDRAEPDARAVVQVGASEMVIDRIFYPALADLYHARPDLEVRFTALPSRLSTVPMLGDLGMNVGFLLLADRPEFVTGRHLGEVQIGIFCQRQLLLRSREALPILPPVPGGAVDKLLTRHLEQEHARQYVRARVAQTGGSALDLALHGLGACCIPVVDALPHQASGALEMIDRLPPLHAYSFHPNVQAVVGIDTVEEYFARMLVQYFAIATRAG